MTETLCRVRLMRRIERCFVSVVIGASVLLAGFPAAEAQCPSVFILSPFSEGQHQQSRLVNLFSLIDALYKPGGATRTISINGKTLQVPPWFSTSSDCGISSLKNGQGSIDPPLASPSFSNYLVVSDELSELALVTALGDSDDNDRMIAIYNTIQAMESSVYPGMPCWIAEVQSDSIRCRSQDTASDATARFGLAYYLAANNSNFPSEWRTAYRLAGDTLASRHLAVEYATGCFLSAVTGQSICRWAAGGGDTAAGGVGGLNMWIGYFPDIARFLIAAYQSSRDLGFLQRAQEVVDQWLVASRFDGGALSVGSFDFGWDTSVNPIVPRAGNHPSYWSQDPAWDDSDAPRALWMGDVLRAISLSSEGAPLSGPYSVLLEWVDKIQAAQAAAGRPATESCIQLNHDGTPYSNCGHDFYYTGLGTGLYTYLDTALLQPKLDEALSQFGWADSQTWNSQSCFGIYRGVRPVKALASAIGLDSETYGGGRTGRRFNTLTPCRLLDTRATASPLAAGEIRELALAGTGCGVPVSAQALSLNITVTQATEAGHLSFAPGSCAIPLTSTINFNPGQTRANNAILSLAHDGSGTLAARATVQGTGAVHLIVDVNGYFE